MKNEFNITQKALFVPDDVTIWLKNSCNTHVDQYLKKRNFFSYQNITGETFFLKNHTQSVVEKVFRDPFLDNQN